MNEQVDVWLTNPYVETAAYFSVTILAVVVFLAVFELVTSYDNWEEIRKGNVAVAMATGGKIFGICNIFRFSIQNHDSLFQSLVWASFGFLLLLAAYFLFEFLTPFFRIDREIENGNKAVGLIAMVISVAASYVVGAGVS